MFSMFSISLVSLNPENSDSFSARQVLREAVEVLVNAQCLAMGPSSHAEIAGVSVFSRWQMPEVYPGYPLYAREILSNGLLIVFIY